MRAIRGGQCAIWSAVWSSYFVYAGLFSLAINVLLLVPALYMLQVFDRVLSSRSEETLVMLSVGALLALAMMAALDVLRARLLAACGMALDRWLGPGVLQGLLEQTARLGGAEHLNGLRDVGTLRGFLVGPGVIALFDAPWLPLFLLLICLFHPLLGAVALAGAVLMLLLAVLNERFTRAPLEQVLAAGRRAGRFIDASTANAETVSALGMQRAVTRRWQALNEAALREQSAASGLGATFSGLTKFTRQFIQMAMLGGGRLAGDRAARVGGRDDRLHHHPRARAGAGGDAGRRMAQPGRGARRLAAAARSCSPPIRPRRPATALPAPRGELAVERLLFAFPGAARPTLRGVSFSLPAGESLGIIGPIRRRQVHARAPASSACGSRRRGRCAWTAPTSRPGSASSLARTSATCRRRWGCSPARWRRTSRASASPMPQR